MRNMMIGKWLVLIVLGMLSMHPAHAVVLDELSGFWVTHKDAKQLTAQPRPCKKPASFTEVSMPGFPYMGTPVAGRPGAYLVDPHNWHQFIDLDGDGICEVEAEICNHSTATKHPDNGDTYFCYSWESAFQYRNGRWVLDLNLHGGVSGGRYRGAAAFKYFDRRTGKVLFSAYHDFHQDSAGPVFVITYFGPPYPSEPGQGWPQSRYDIYDDEGPFQHRGAYIYFLELHIQRLLSEYLWRVEQCGGPQGYRDTDSRTVSLEQLVNMIAMFILPVEELGKLRTNMESSKVAAVKRWHTQVRKTMGLTNPGDSSNLTILENRCKPKGGYRDVDEYSDQRKR
jgi:hypothetical protein